MPHLFFFFPLPSDPAKMQIMQDTFLLSSDFWGRHVGRLTFWGHPVGVTKTETPDGKPALALLLDQWNNEDMLYSMAKQIAEDLGAEAYSLLIAEVEPKIIEEIILEQTIPWEEGILFS